MSNSISYAELRISVLDTLYIKELSVKAGINYHTEMRLTAVLSKEQKVDRIVSSQHDPIEVYALTREGKKTIYWGIITQVKVTTGAEYYEIEIWAKSFTYLMDIKRKEKSFQDIHKSIEQLVSEVAKIYPNGDVVLNLPNKSLDRLWIQYKETDWEFIKRVVSSYRVGIFPHVTKLGTYFCIGTPSQPQKEIAIYEYIATKKQKEYYDMVANECEEICETDYITYDIKSYELLELGDGISFNGKDYYISTLEYCMNDGMIEGHYTMQPKNGQKQKRINAHQLTGISLEGKVIEVTGDQVKIHLDIDKTQVKETAYWFTFSTVAASPDGSGWYFMPEVNDRARVYFPTSDEKDAFSISCIQQIKGDPDVKYISTIYGKQLIFTPDSITITANNEATIVLHKSGGISVTGSNIHVNASESISMRAENELVVSAKNKVEISCDQGGKTTLQPDGSIELNGTKIRIN